MNVQYANGHVVYTCVPGTHFVMALAETDPAVRECPASWVWDGRPDITADHTGAVTWSR